MDWNSLQGYKWGDFWDNMEHVILEDMLGHLNLLYVLFLRADKACLYQNINKLWVKLILEKKDQRVYK